MKLVRFAISFALGTLISRILGFLRDAGIAYYFGASHISDAFFVAFRIPNSFRRLLGEGGFNAAFVPLYTRAVEEGREREFLGKVFSFYLLINALVTFLGVILSEYIVSLLAPGLRDTEAFDLAVFMARFLFLYLLLVGLSALFMGVLNVKGRFFVPAVSQGIFNAAFLITLILLSDSYGHVALIVGVIAGGILQVLIYLPSLVNAGVAFSPSIVFDDEVKLLVRRLVPALGGFGVNQLSLFIDTILASFLKTGAISYLYYANRLYQLPFGIVSVGVANSLLSLLSKSSINRNLETTRAFRLVLLLIIPASAGLIILSEEIVRVIYQRGNFSEEDARITATVLSIYSLGLLFSSLQKVLSAEFFSRGDTKTPVKVSLISVLSEGLFGFLLAFPLGLGLYGLSLGTALSFLVGFSLLMVKKEVKIERRDLVSTLLKSSVASLGMSLLVLWIKNSLESAVQILALSIPMGAILYFLILFLLREELALGLFKGLVKKGLNP